MKMRASQAAAALVLGPVSALAGVVLVDAMGALLSPGTPYGGQFLEWDNWLLGLMLGWWGLLGGAIGGATAAWYGTPRVATAVRWARGRWFGPFPPVTLPPRLLAPASEIEGRRGRAVPWVRKPRVVATVIMGILGSGIAIWIGIVVAIVLGGGIEYSGGPELEPLVPDIVIASAFLLTLALGGAAGAAIGWLGSGLIAGLTPAPPAHPLVSVALPATTPPANGVPLDVWRRPQPPGNTTDATRTS